MRPKRTLNPVAPLLLLALCGCRAASRPPASESFKSMGTVATITVGGTDHDRLRAVTAEVRAEFDRLEELFSNYREASEISRLAIDAGKCWTNLSPDTRRILELSRKYGELTGGAFDITVGPLVRLWGFGGNAPSSVPEPAEITEALKSVGFRRLELSSSTGFLPAGMRVDLGGIGKGYAVDHGAAILRRRGVRSAMVDFSGNIMAIGQPGDGEPWTVGVRNPFDRDHVLGTLALEDGWAVASSGSYERFVELGGRRYSHIIDPRTGYPVEGMAGTTVLCTDATSADAMSTSLFVLGVEEGLRVLRQTPCAGALFIPDRDPVEIRVSPGMERVFTPLPEFASSVKPLR